MPSASAIAIRIASARDLDTLCKIDLETGALFAQAGLVIDISDDHEYSRHERLRWLRCLAAQTTLVALDEADSIVGFAASGELDGEPYLEQLSVRMNVMRRGIGTALLAAAISMARESGGRALWLTTYGHLPWNKPFYEQNGFTVVPPGGYGQGIAGEIDFQRRWLPLPEQRVVMRRLLSD